MHAHNIDHLFHGLEFTKSAMEIKDRCEKKAEELKAKVEARQQRLSNLRREYEMDDAALVQLLTAARHADKAASHFFYSLTKMSVSGKRELEERTIGAGVVTNLLTENDFIEAERDQVKTLERIARNIKEIPRFSMTGAPIPPEEYTLTQEELAYLGF